MLAEDGETWLCGARSNPTAHKRHVCCECGGYIEPGETYERVSGVWTGGLAATYATCGKCVGLRLMAARQGIDACFGDLFEELDNAGLLPASEKESLR